MAHIKIFVSYRRRDEPARVDRICDHLREHFGSDSVIRDYDSLRAGPSLQTQIEDLIAWSRVMLVIIGPGWSKDPRLFDQDDPVRFELETAIRKCVPVIPVLVGTAMHPVASDLPDSLHFLVESLACSVRDDPDFKSDMRAVLEACWELRDEESRPESLLSLPAIPADLVPHFQRLVWSADAMRQALIAVASGQDHDMVLSENQEYLAAADAVVTRWLQVFPSADPAEHSREFGGEVSTYDDREAALQILERVESEIRACLDEYDSIATAANEAEQMAPNISEKVAKLLWRAIRAYQENRDAFTAKSRNVIESAMAKLPLTSAVQKFPAILDLAQLIAAEARFSVRERQSGR